MTSFDVDLRLADLVGTSIGTPPTIPARKPAAGMEFAPQQQEAIEKIVDWYTAEQDSPQIFRLFGYAGTGKTTLARHIVDELGVNAQYAAFTGKAAYVLQQKGCEARTIHSLIYQAVEKVRARLEELKRQRSSVADPADAAVLDRAIEVEEEKLHTPDWILREDSELAFAPLLVLDEVSMVGEKIAADLLSFGVKVLCLGDPAQLPPVEGGGYFIHATPDHLLTEIHRSALDSPVARLATSVRRSPPGDRTLGMAGMDGDSGRCQFVTRDQLAGFDQVLVGTNKTRWQAIHLLRDIAGLAGPIPQPGDKVIGLANNSDVFNGQQFAVVSAKEPDRDRITLQLLDDAGDERRITCWLSGFAGQDGEKLAKRDGRGTVSALTFAQAITCHKSQGSHGTGSSSSTSRGSSPGPPPAKPRRPATRPPPRPPPDTSTASGGSTPRSRGPRSRSSSSIPRGGCPREQPELPIAVFRYRRLGPRPRPRGLDLRRSGRAGCLVPNRT
ncbi:ATP-dependent DNA helicase [Actinoplanes regularis]|uniref:ATP-dependent DNA helicase n=1 Tax=Actinoplanes regularis TaxID=52697 RepID=UPI00117812A7|nr:AAA family ATPase [Actinoplanes regularis]